MPKLSGEAEEFHDCLFQFKAFLRLEHGFEEFVVMIEDLKDEPEVRDPENYRETKLVDVRWLDEQLYALLVNRALPASKAMTTVKHCEDLIGIRGAKALFRIAHECRGHRGELRMDALRDAVREPKTCASHSEVLMNIKDWG